VPFDQYRTFLEAVMDPQDEYRQRAEDCIRLARLMANAADRRMMLAAAGRWRALAENHPEGQESGDGLPRR
jgi:hypothetical protein